MFQKLGGARPISIRHAISWKGTSLTAFADFDVGLRLEVKFHLDVFSHSPVFCREAAAGPTT